MKRFTSYLKLLLVAVGLLAGSNASAADTVVGAEDNTTGWWTAFSDYYTLEANQTLTLSFTNYSDQAENFHNWLAVVTNDVDRAAEGYSEYFVLRNDNYGWAGGKNTKDDTSWYTSLTSNFNWDTFKEDMDGAEVVLTLERKGAQVTLNADITAADGVTKYFEKFVINCGDGTQKIRLFMTTEAGHLAIHSANVADTEGIAFAGVKMTYVDSEAADDAIGEIAAGETAKTGYNKISGGAVALGNAAWHCNWITYLQVDASGIPADATITNAVLSFEQSGSTDSKRTTGVGAGYNSSVWASDMTYNTADKSITTLGDVVWTSTKSATVFEAKTINITPALASDDDKIVTILLYETAAAGCYIKNPMVTLTYTTEAVADYTVKYVATIEGEEKEIKDARTETGVVGQTAAIVDADKADIVFEGVKYVYDADDADAVTIQDDNSSVVTVSFVEAPSYTYTVADNLGNTLVSDKAYEGDNVNFWVPYYVFQDGKFYKNPTLSAGSLSYGQSTISSISEDVDITVTYTEEEGTDVVFFSEAENLTGVTPYEDGFTQIRMSNGKTGYYAAEAAFVKLPAGTYTLTAATRAGATTFFAGAVGEGTELMKLESTGSVVTTTSAPFTLTEETEIYASVGNSKAYFDYVIIRELKPITVSISDAGWATLFTGKALNFAESGLKAYTATCDGATVTLTEVTTVPANTGVVLKGEKGNYDVAVTAASATEKGDLQGSATEATAYDAFDGYELYALAMNGDEAQFCQVVSGEIAAGKAFLKVAEETEVSALRVVFGETDGIEALTNAENETSNAMFDLSGRRVLKAQKGIYVKNGKKVIF